MNNPNQTITQHPFFRGMKPRHLDLLTEGVKAVHFKAGGELFRAIEPTNAVALSGAHPLVTTDRNPESGYELMKRVARIAIVIQRLQPTCKQWHALQVEATLDG